MSVIFPTEPAKVNIHLVPKNADKISYRVADTLVLSAWMPDGFHTIHQKSKMTNDEFFESYCDGCHRNCYGFLEEYTDEETGDIDWDDPDLADHCSVYDDGYHGQICPRGFELQDEYVDFDIANMVFEIHLTHLGTSPRFTYTKDSAYLQASTEDEDGIFVGTYVEMASNVFGDASYPEGICWGYNPRPNNLREIVSFYFSTPFNNDLCSLDVFQENCREIRYSVDTENYSKNNLDSGEKILAYGIDAVMILDAEENIQGFYTMLMAGFKPLPEAPHVMLIPLKECEFERNGNLYRGYSTIPDAVGKSWFVSPDIDSEGLLVGQL